MPIDHRNLKPSPAEKKQIEKIHQRIEAIVKRGVELYPTEAHFFLSFTMRMLAKGFPTYLIEMNGGEKKSLAELLAALKLTTQTGEFDLFVWDALITTKPKWRALDDPSKLLRYVRQTARNMYKQSERSTSILYKLEPLDEKAEMIGQFNNDIDLMELWITVEQSISHNEKVKPDKRQDVIDLIRARIFEGVTRNLAAEHLGWNESRVIAVWKEIARKKLIENLL